MRGYPQALPRLPNFTVEASILFSTLEPREVILRKSQIYLTITAAGGHSRHLVNVILRQFRVYLILLRQADTTAILFSLFSGTSVLPNLTAAVAILFSTLEPR